MGLLGPGPDHDRPTVDVLLATGDPMLARLADVIVDNEIHPESLLDAIAAGGMESLDVWAETRLRTVPPEAVADRMEAVASHLWAGLPAGEARAVVARMRAALAAAADPDGVYRSRFVKTFAVARRLP